MALTRGAKFMPGAQVEPVSLPTDASRSALEFLHGLMQAPAENHAGLPRLLADLAAAFQASGAGTATLPLGTTAARHAAGDGGSRRPRDIDLEWIERAQRAPSAVTATLPGGGSLLLTVVRPAAGAGWVLWLEDGSRTTWSSGEAAALTLAGNVLGRWLAAEGPKPRWAEQLERADRQLHLETAARTAARLAHDFGNLLTSLLGFSELSLAQRGLNDSTLAGYLRELHAGAQGGARMTQQLRLFCRRDAGAGRSCAVVSVLAEEEARLGVAAGRPVVQTTLPTDLPLAALDGDSLRQILGALLDNAREAMPPGGVVHVSGKVVQLTAEDCLDAFGDLRPGPHLEIVVADAGTGLSPEVRRRLFAEPFFSTKPRRRGFGLAVAYGILHAHRGGLLVRPRPEGGTIAHVFVPVASLPAPTARMPALGRGEKTAGRGEKVLVVDDDPGILEFVCATLTHAGFRVKGTLNADEALVCHDAAASDPYRLVLSDVVMPRVNGIELARRLLDREAGLRILFMSGQTNGGNRPPELADYSFNLLSKPFRSEGLVQAVRSALDRPSPQRGARAEEAEETKASLSR